MIINEKYKSLTNYVFRYKYYFLYYYFCPILLFCIPVIHEQNCFI